MVLGEIPRGTALERPYRPLILRVNAQGQHPNRRMACAQLPQRLEKQPTRHRHVEQHQVGGRGLERAEQGGGGVRLARNHHPRVGLHDATEALADDRVVIRDEDANLRVRSAHDTARGMVTAMPVPWPGSPRIIRVPPHAKARSRIPTKPRDRSPESDWGMNPTPLSSTPRMMTPPTRRTDTSTRVALECRVALVSASWMIRKAWLATSSGSRGKSSMWSVTAIPVRWAVSCPRHSIAASRPSWSRTLGRSSLAMRRTICIVSSMRAVIDASSTLNAPELRPRRGRLDPSHARSSFK